MCLRGIFGWYKCLGLLLLFVGGEGDDGKVLSSCEIYKPEDDIWEEGPKLISPRSNLCSVVYQNEIYCAGGCYGGKCHKSFWWVANIKEK